MAFTNYQLYRTTPKLSGNMKMDLVVNDVGGKLHVTDFHLRPLSDLVSYNIVDENILIRPHQLNIARFYGKTKGDFYSAKADPRLLSDWPITLTRKENPQLTKNWDDTYWAGTQRMLYKPYKTTHEILIPVWLESLSNADGTINDVSNLVIEIGLIPDGLDIPLVTKTLKFEPINNDALKYHNDFCKYLNDYFKHVGIIGEEGVSGNNKCLNINLTKNESYIYGLNVEDGNMQTRTDFNITRNLLFRERPLLESNSLLTNSFSDVHLILPQLINFNICFDPSRWIPASVRHLFSQTFYIQSSVKVAGRKLEKYDLYTNHHFVPRPINRDVITNEPEEEPHNALDYKFDYTCTELIHKNKIVQPICHWAMSENPDVLFNLYDGFGASYKGQTINHFFGTVNDISNTTTDPLIPNTSPFGPKMLGDGDEVNYVLNNIEHFVDDEPFFVQLSGGWINSFRIQYKPDETNPIQEILIAGMTTPFDYERYLHKTSDTQTVTDPEYFAIWAARYDKDGYNTLPNTVEHDAWIVDKAKAEENNDTEWDDDNPEPQDERSDYDKLYDVALYHDMDNRWLIGPGGLNSIHRHEINSYGIYFCIKEIDWPRKKYKLTDDHGDPIIVDGEQAMGDAKALVVLIWDQQIERKEGINDDLIFKTKRSSQNIGFIIESLRRYIAYVKAMNALGNIQVSPDKLELLEKLDLLNEAAQASEFPGVWYFNNTISQKQDNSVSNSAKEINYLKNQAKDAYVYRFDGQIKPAMYPPLTEKSTQFGLNYFWTKSFYDYQKYESEDRLNYKDNFMAYKKHAQTGVPPMFPSLNYECVLMDKNYGDALNPDKEYQRTHNYKEYKWFDKSKVVQYPISLEAEVDSESADRKNDVELAVKAVIYNKLKNQMADELYDEQYVHTLYKINYELLRVKKVQDSSRPEGYKLLYTYKITMKLK